jgi:hypothetical protein
MRNFFSGYVDRDAFLTSAHSNTQRMPKKKNPTVAAVLALLFGPLGYLYIGWKYTVMGTAVVFIFISIFA